MAQVRSRLSLSPLSPFFLTVLLLPIPFLLFFSVPPLVLDLSLTNSPLLPAPQIDSRDHSRARGVIRSQTPKPFSFSLSPSPLPFCLLRRYTKPPSPFVRFYLITPFCPYPALRLLSPRKPTPLSPPDASRSCFSSFARLARGACLFGLGRDGRGLGAAWMCSLKSVFWEARRKGRRGGGKVSKRAGLV